MIVSFITPYGAGTAGERLKAITGLPLVYCSSDSQSCTDMNPCFPSRFHYRRARRLDDGLSERRTRSQMRPVNADLVRSRQPLNQHEKSNVVVSGQRQTIRSSLGVPSGTRRSSKDRVPWWMAWWQNGTSVGRAQ